MASSSGTFFGIQVAIRTSRNDPWRARRCDLIRDHMRDMSWQDHRGFYGALTNLLLEATDRATLGTWDLVPDGGAEYDDWISGIEDDVSTPWVPDPSGAAMDHVLVSVMFLLQKHGPSAQLCGERLDLSESTWTARGTYRYLFETIPMLDHRSILGDAAFVTPGGAGLGLSLTELRGDGYQYLDTIRK